MDSKDYKNQWKFIPLSFTALENWNRVNFAYNVQSMISVIGFKWERLTSESRFVKDFSFLVYCTHYEFTTMYVVVLVSKKDENLQPLFGTN